MNSLEIYEVSVLLRYPKKLRAYADPRFFRPLPLALLASSATGSARIAPPLETRLHFHSPSIGNENRCFARPSPREQYATGILHLVLRVSTLKQKRQTAKSCLSFLVTRWRLELQTHCLKGKVLILRTFGNRKPVVALALSNSACLSAYTTRPTAYR